MGNVGIQVLRKNGSVSRCGYETLVGDELISCNSPDAMVTRRKLQSCNCYAARQARHMKMDDVMRCLRDALFSLCASQILARISKVVT